MTLRLVTPVDSPPHPIVDIVRRPGRTVPSGRINPLLANALDLDGAGRGDTARVSRLPRIPKAFRADAGHNINIRAREGITALGGMERQRQTDHHSGPRRTAL